MLPPLLAILCTLLLGLSSLLVVIYRVSPLLAPQYALPFFFISIFFSVSSAVAFLFLLFRGLIIFRPLFGNPHPHPKMMLRKAISISLREGIFIGIAACIIIFLWLLQIMTLWMAAMVFLVFIFVDLAMGR